MSSYLFCATYQDLTCDLRICRGHIGIEFRTKQRETEESMYFSLNPMQAKTFAESLQNMAMRIPVKEIKNTDVLGNLEVYTEIEEENNKKIYHKEEDPVA
jgi:uncharacterized protein YicC (UPF0701 family)